MALAGLEPAIFGSDDHRFTHEATRPHVALRLARGRLEDFGEPSGALGRLAAPRILAGTQRFKLLERKNKSGIARSPQGRTV